LWPLLLLQPLSIRARGLAFALRDPRAGIGDRLGLLAHAGLWIVAPAWVLGWADAALAYLAGSLLTSVFVASTFLWNHLGTQALARGERLPWFEQRLRCSRDLSDHPVVTWIFGGLNHHVEHHLLPTVPVPHLKRARAILVEVLAEHGLTLRTWGWLESMRAVHAHLRAMAATVPAPSAAPPTLAPLPAGPTSDRD
jgi:fatty acid desaturase